MVGKMKVLAVLESLPGVGKVKARRTMEEIGIAETRRVRGLGAQQRKRCSTAFSRLTPVARAASAVATLVWIDRSPARPARVGHHDHV